MDTPVGVHRKPSLIAPGPFFAGIGVAFLALCLAGWWCARGNLYRDFVRFHWRINPETLYYQTASQLLALGKEKLPPDRVAVIVGGNSILNGIGQRVEHLWTKHLQEQLGDEYVVLNLADASAWAFEFGGTAAEMLVRDHPRLIFITDVGSSGTLTPEIDGNVYRHVFWDAYFKGLLPPDARREERLAEILRERANDEGFAELRRRMGSNAYLRFLDFWTAVQYRTCNTVWLPPLRRTPFAPRVTYRDEMRSGFMKVTLLDAGHSGHQQTVLRSLLDPTLGARWLDMIRASTPESLEGRTLFAVHRDNPHYVRHLTPAEQEEYGLRFREFNTLLEEAGIAAVDIGEGLGVEDFTDFYHISERGGHKVAEMVAPKVKALAQKLGYVK